MDNRIDILNELNALSPAIAAIQNRNVFTVPAGYFDHLAEGIVMNVKADAGNLFSGAEETPAAVPSGYFDSLADAILNKIKAQETVKEELNGLSPILATIANKNVFTVPNTYFESITNTILNRIVTDNAAAEMRELSPVLHRIQHENVFTVPQGYFDSLSGNVLSKVNTAERAAIELKTLSPILYGIQNQNVFSVPRGYFESLPEAILNQVQAPPAKLVTMTSRRTFSVIKYAVAAMFTGVMALGIYKFIDKGTDIKTELGSVEKSGIEIAKTNKFDEEFLKVSDDDIIKYLQANGSGVDVALVANTMDEKELPAQEDYLTDDKALDKYLDNVDLKDLNN